MNNLRKNSTSLTDADQSNKSSEIEHFSTESPDSRDANLTSTGQDMKQVLDEDIVERHARIGRQYSRIRKRS